MKEIGSDISKNFSKSIDDLPPRFITEIDYIITLCAEEICPIMVAPKAKKIHWPLPDPATSEPISETESLHRFRQTRDDIRDLLMQLRTEIVP
jgi:arsenate reductase